MLSPTYNSFFSVSSFSQRIILSPTYNPFFQRIVLSPTYQHIILSLTCYSFSIVSFVLRRVFFFGLSYFLRFVTFSSTCIFSPAYHSSYVCCFFYYISIILSSSHTTLYVISSLSNKIQKNNLCINYQRTYYHIISSRFFNTIPNIIFLFI